MPLETASHISGLVSSNPASSDGLNQADDHLRLIKSVLLTDVGNALVSKSLAVVDGSSGAPSVGFAADATAGFYRKATGVTAVVGNLVGQGTVPIGSLIDFAGTAAPTGYLACDGTLISRTTYADLFAAIGTTWGVGDGSTTFAIPDLRDRFRRHRNTTGGSRAGLVGNTQADVFKTHTHTYSGTTGVNSVDHTHAVSLTTGTMNSNTSHSHSSSSFFTPGAGSVGGGGAFGAAITANTSTVNIDHTHPVNGNTGGASVTHTHSITGTSDATGDATETRPYSATVLTCIRAL
jgi:microcystin-dependent protein